MLNSDLSSAAPQGGRNPPQKTRVVSTRRRVPTNWVSGRTLQPSIESVVANSFVPSDFLVDGQISGLGLKKPPSHFKVLWQMESSSSFYVFNVEEEVVIIRNGWTPKKKRRRTTTTTTTPTNPTSTATPTSTTTTILLLLLLQLTLPQTRTYKLSPNTTM